MTLYQKKLDRDFLHSDENDRIQEAYMKVLNEGKKTFVSAYVDNNVLKWRTEDGRTGSDPMKNVKDVKKHLKKVLGSDIELEMIKK